jgi:hypothetical protein
MQHHERSFDTCGEVQRLERVLERGLAFAI